MIETTQKELRERIDIRVRKEDQEKITTFYNTIKRDGRIVYQFIMLLPIIFEALAEIAAEENMDVLSYLKKICLDKKRAYLKAKVKKRVETV